MNIQLPNGKTVYRSLIEYLSIEDDEIDLYYQELMADDQGDFVNNPFSSLKDPKVIEEEILPDIPD